MATSTNLPIAVPVTLIIATSIAGCSVSFALRALLSGQLAG